MKMFLRSMQVAVLALACSSCVIQTPGHPTARETVPAPAPAPAPGYQAPRATAPAATAPAATAPAATAPAAAQSTRGGVAVVSATSVAGLGGRHLNQFRTVDDKITARIKQDLQNRGIGVAEAQTAWQPYTLAFSVEKVDCGRNELCQKGVTIGVSYAFKRYSTVIRSGRFEEHSQPGWEKSIRKIAEVIGGETAAGMVSGPAGYKAPASAALPVAPRDEGRIAVLSETSTAGLTGKRLNQFRGIDASLMKGIGKDLQDHGVGVAAPQSGAQRYVLSVKLDKLDCGPKDRCQVSAAIGASYVLKKDGAVLKSDNVEEHSKDGWQKSVNKITERIAGDVAGAMGRR